jgi:hypothetical protein
MESPRGTVECTLFEGDYLVSCSGLEDYLLEGDELAEYYEDEDCSTFYFYAYENHEIDDGYGGSAFSCYYYECSGDLVCDWSFYYDNYYDYEDTYYTNYDCTNNVCTLNCGRNSQDN